MARSCNFTFTYNNYPDTIMVDSIDCKYIVYGKEVGESGTPHLQGALSFDTQRSLPSVIKKLPGCHVEIARDIHKASAYCKKDGDVTERGTPPTTSKQKGEDEQIRWKRYRVAAEQGDLEEIPEKIQFLNPRLLTFHREKFLKARALQDTETQHLWYYGDSGTGKSRKARTDHPEAYLKTCNKWWDGFLDHETVIIEDFDEVHKPLCHHLKIWGDRYPFPAECKGSVMKIRPKLIIITSNYHPRDIWTNPKDLEPILRRFKCEHFGELPKKRKIADLTEQMSR